MGKATLFGQALNSNVRQFSSSGLSCAIFCFCLYEFERQTYKLISQITLVDNCFFREAVSILPVASLK